MYLGGRRFGSVGKAFTLHVQGPQFYLEIDIIRKEKDIFKSSQSSVHEDIYIGWYFWVIYHYII